jgi:hypothetical protein
MLTDTINRRNGGNGKAHLGQDEVPANPPAPAQKSNMALALLPFTPVPFTGSDSLLAYGRIALYGVAAGLTWEKHRKLSYVFAGAAGLSLVTSLSANAYQKKV